jgi:hypothetical protein
MRGRSRLDESPMAHRRLPDVLAHHAGSIRVLHTLRSFAVAMAGEGASVPIRRSVARRMVGLSPTSAW